MRRLVRPGGAALAILVAVAVACNAILSNRDATYVTEAGAPAQGCADGGYQCGLICVPPGNPSFGCSIDSNCHPCAFVHATGACNGTACFLSRCDPGYDHCDPDAGPGCETNVATDNDNCGGCGHRCSAGASCSNGVCLQGCQAPYTACGQDCVDLDDPKTCGSSCGFFGPCYEPPDPNAYAVCEAGTCAVACDFPGGSYCQAAGYCADLSSDNNNCQVCGNVCPPTTTCQSYQCCTPGGAPCQVNVAPCCPGQYVGSCTDAGACCIQPNNGLCLGDGDCCSGKCDVASEICL